MSAKRWFHEQMQRWPGEYQKFYRDSLAHRRSQFPNEEQRWAENITFREVRQVLLEDGGLQLEDVPGWGLKGRGMTREQRMALPNDHGYENLKLAMQRVEEDRRRRVAEASDYAEPGKVVAMRGRR